MNVEEKLEMLKTILDIPSSDSSEDSRLTVYLSVAEREIIGWRYSYSSQTVETVPAEYEMVQVWSVVNGFSQSGAEGQTSHSENGISRGFSYPDMIHYIRKTVIPLCGVL
jgi:hypothetical protein